MQYLDALKHAQSPKMAHDKIALSTGSEGVEVLTEIFSKIVKDLEPMQDLDGRFSFQALENPPTCLFKYRIEFDHKKRSGSLTYTVFFSIFNDS